MLPTTKEMVTMFAKNASKTKDWEKNHREGRERSKRRSFR